MTHAQGTDCGGVRNIDRLKDRCYVDPECGCWHWRLSFHQGSPRVGVRHPVTGRLVKMRGRRAALVLSRGVDLPKGHSAFAKPYCLSFDCVNPDHASSGTRAAAGKAHAAAGLTKPSFRKRQSIHAACDKRRKLTPQQVREIRAGGKPDHAWARELGVAPFTVWSARHGHSYKHVPVSAPSVFEWRG